MKFPGIVAVAVIILVVGAVGFYYVEETRQVQQQQAPVVPPAPPPFTKKFEDVLNDFLKNVAEKSQDYKTGRKVVVELIKPQNLADPAYAQENNQMMQKTVIELQAKMDAIMAVFKDTEAQVQGLLAGQPPDKQKEILESWRKMRDQQAGLYLAFFTSEQDVLAAYKDLMQFYADRPGAYTYDASADGMLFRDPAAKQQELALREKIKTMEEQQAMLLKKPAN